MAPRMLRLGLSFIVGLGCWFGKVEAQEPVQAPADQGIVQAPGQVVSRLVHPVAALRDRSEVDGRAREALNRHGYRCAQHHNWYGCGGWYAQNVFVFGSCRTFFGEPCLPKAPGERGIFSGGNCNR